MPKKKQRKAAGRVVRRRLADGTIKEYRYAPYRAKRPTADPNSLDALIRQYRRSPEWDALKPHSQQMYNTYLRPLEEIGHLPVQSINRREILTLRDAIAFGRGPGAASGFLQAASTLFKWAVSRDWITHNPAHGIERLPGGEFRAWTRAEADQATASLPEHLRRVVILARYTGQRRSDLCAMTWAAFDGTAIRVKQEKTSEQMVIPCHPALIVELRAWRRDTNAVTILTNTQGRPWVPQHLSHALPTALARLGMPRDLNVHGLRKLAATELADAGCSIHEIAAITGHRTLQMVQHYTRTADQRRLAEAAIVKLQTHTNWR